MTPLELIIVGIITAAIYCLLFAILLDLIVKVEYDISSFLLLTYFVIVVAVIVISLKVLLVVI